MGEISSIRVLFVRKAENMKYKEFIFDLEYIHDFKVDTVGKEVINVSTHRTVRGIKLTDIVDIVRHNLVPIDEDSKITLIIRGVNF